MEGTGVGGVQRAGLREGSAMRPCRGPGCGHRESLDSRQQEVQPRAHSPAGLGLEGKEGLVPQHQLLFPTLGNSSFTPHPHHNPAAIWALAALRYPSRRKLALAVPGGNALPSQSSCSPKCCSPRTWVPARSQPSSSRGWVDTRLGAPGLRLTLPMGPRSPAHSLPFKQDSGPNCACGRNPDYPESCQEIKDMPTFFKTSL